MGSVLNSQKRFFYLIKSGSGKNIIILYDVWTMKKLEIELPDKYQIIDIQELDDQIYLLDVDQKVIQIDCKFLSDQSYLSYNDISIHENRFKNLGNEFKKKIQKFFIPFRTTITRFDSVITDKDYDLKNYYFMQFIKNFILFCSRNIILVLNKNDFLRSDFLSNFEGIQEYIQQYKLLLFQFHDIECKKFIKFEIEKFDHIFMVSKNNRVFYINEDLLEIAWN